MILKKKSKIAKTLDEAEVLMRKIAGVEVTPTQTPKAVPACGYAFNGLIYLTLEDANMAYQLHTLESRVQEFRADGCTYPSDIMRLWPTLRKIAHKKLEVE